MIAVLLIGGVSSWTLLNGYQSTVEEHARRDANLLGSSVARTLAQQFEKAGRYGIPFTELPGIHAYLQRTLDDIPGLARIALHAGDGKVLDAVERRNAPGKDTVNAAITVNSLKLGDIAITTAPAELTRDFEQVRIGCALATLLIALLAGAATALGAGKLLDRRRAELEAALKDNTEGRFNHDLSSASQGNDALAAAFRALADGEDQVRERFESFDGYAQELLAVDFDDRLRPEIEMLIATVHLARPQEVR